MSHSEENIPDINEEERQHFQRITNAYRFYRIHQNRRLVKVKKYISTFPAEQQVLLKNYNNHLHVLGSCFGKNYNIIKLIIDDVENLFLNAKHTDDKSEGGSEPSISDMEKVQTVLKQITREWSSVGAEEREACFEPIIREIEAQYADVPYHDVIKILVPGSGLGRLVYELAFRGFSSQGNEYSLFMLMASNFILNKCNDVNVHTIYPWVHQNTNCFDHTNQMESVTFPDVNPSLLPEGNKFSMAAGDFIDIYTDTNEWDCIATCFFIDCANNIITYIQTIYKILKAGGIWINFGPLLYHFADVPNEDSIELSYVMLKKVIIDMGFVYEKEEVDIPCTYSQNPHSMLKYEYKCVFFVCKKPLVNNTQNGNDSSSSAEP